jgi:hypothetical protein
MLGITSLFGQLYNYLRTMYKRTASYWVEHFIEYLGPIPDYSVDAPDSRIIVESLQCPNSNEWVVKLQAGGETEMCFTEHECHALLRHFKMVRGLIMPESMVADYPNIDRTSV